MAMMNKRLRRFFCDITVNIHRQFFLKSNKTREMSLSSLHLKYVDLGYS